MKYYDSGCEVFGEEEYNGMVALSSIFYSNFVTPVDWKKNYNLEE